MARPAWFRVPRPQTFLHFMTLRTGTELIALTLLINKLAGLYGILALLTGYPLSPLQLSMYVYSLLALGLAAYLAPHVRRQSPLQCLALACFYALDSVVNAAYTAAFAVAWFVVLASRGGGGGGGDADKPRPPGAATIADAAGSTGPRYNVSRVDVDVDGAAAPGQDAVALGQAAGGGGGVPVAGIGNAVFQSGSVASITIIAALWALRLYFVFVVLAYARAVLRAHIASSAGGWDAAAGGGGGGGAAGLAEDPFARGRDGGAGWRGALGRAMVRVGRTYWLGREEDEEQVWMRGLGGKFRKSAQPEGVVERERRRRSGTGPPPPPPQLPQFVGEAR